MKQKLKRFMAGFMAMLTLVGTLFTNGTTAFAASPQANIAFWNASVKNSGEVSELKPGYNHGKILYSILDGNSAYCMNFGLRADGGQLMNSYDDTSTSMSAQQRKLLSYCLYYGFNSTQKAAPSNSQCDEYIATQAMVWVIVADIFGTGSGDSAARKLCNTAPSPDSSYSYYERLRDNISSSYNATLPSFASRRTSEAPTYELKWNEGSQRFETTLSDSNGVLSDFDFGISGYSVDKNGSSITISSTSVNTTATTGTFTSNAGKVETTSSCVFWLTGKSGYQEFISERPTADPVKAYIKVKTENIGYGELTKTDESSGVKLSGAVYGIYSDSGCTNRVQTMTTDGNGYAKSAALVAGTYYVKEITAPKGYVLSGTVHTLTVKAGQTTGISATDKEQLGAITIYKEGEVLSSWNGSNFTYEKKKLSGATFKVTAGADIYKADGTKVYSAGDVVAESLTTGTDGQVVLSDLHLGTYVVTEIKSIDGYTINTTPQTVAVEYKDQTVTVQYESTTIENTRQKADVSVVKKDSDTENPLDGGKYTLYAGNDIKNYTGQVIVTKGTALETVTTGEDGKASYSVDLPISNGYYIQETQAPYAYIRNSKDVYSFNFNVLPETQAKASFSYTFVNDRTTAKIHIYKVDKESGKAAAQGDASLEGAVYGLYARNDIVHPDGATGVVFKAGDLVATLTTDKNGEAEVNNLYLGNYYVKEITPSEGYLLDEEEHDVVCDYEGDLVAEVSRSTTSAEQVIKQPFQLIKVSDNGDDTEAGLLAGAEFTAYLKSSLPVKADGSYDFDKAAPVVIGENGATTITSDDKGHAVSIAIPYGTYVVVESKTPHNMKTIKPFEVKIKENHPTEPQTWRVFLDREFTAKLRVIKKDSDTKQTVLVPNAEFKIFNLDKNEYVKQYTTYPSKVEHTSFFTDEDGDLILPEALKIGNYRIEEVSAPFGYVVNDKYVNISVDTDTAFETDGDTNDAIITVEYSDAPAVGELTVEKKGEVLDGFKGGLLASSYEKEFVYKEGSLAGAKFKVYAAEDIYTADNQKDADGNRIKYYSKGDLVTTLTTGKDGKATAKNLPLGQYRVVEVEAPYGYVLNPNEQKVTFTYVDDKTPVIKETEKKEIEEIMDDVRENDQCLFFVGVTIILMAESKKELESVCETVETIGKRNSCTIDTHYLKQREALNTALPIGVRQVETMRTLLTQSLAVLMPFNVQELNDSTGNYYGINQISKNVNIGNRKKLINGNGFVFGVPGSGKSFFCKMEMGSVFLSGDDEIIVIDPMNEYFDIAETYGGTVVNMSTYTDNYVNPLEMDVWSLDPNDSKGMVREKGEFMLGLCEQCIGDSLNSRQKSIIDRCVRKLYIDIARSKEKYIPVMSDFYDILMAQPEDEAKDIALSLELFVNGSLNIFNHQTNVDVDNRFTVYGIRDLGTELSPITMLVMMESIQNRIVENGKRGKATWLYIDEFHVLLNSEYSAKYLQQLWKKVRKQGGLCTGITQNVVDLLQNYTATTMLANSEFVALLKQANTDSSKMAEVIGVSEAQLRFVTNTASGMGLIKCGSVVIPFDNQISKDTDLYRLYNTNIHEKIAEQKKREMQKNVE